MDLLQTTTPWWRICKCSWAGGEVEFIDAYHKGSFRSWQFHVGTKRCTKHRSGLGVEWCILSLGLGRCVSHCSQWREVLRAPQSPCWASLHWLKWSFMHIPQSNLIFLWVGHLFRWLLEGGSGHLVLVCILAFIKGKFKSFRAFWRTRSLCFSSWNHSFHEHKWKMQISLWNPCKHACISTTKTILVRLRSMTWHLLELQANISNADLRLLLYYGLFAPVRAVHYIHWLQRHLSILAKQISDQTHG